MSSSKSRKVALITGAGSGIGRSVALALSREGYSVVLAGRRSAVFWKIRRLSPEAYDSEATVLVAPTDVTDPASVEALFAKVREGFGRLDLLFNNAGISAPPVLLEELTLEQWNSVVNTSLTGAFLCTREAFKLMKSQRPQGGRIINNGSISASFAPAQFSALHRSQACDHGADKIHGLGWAQVRHRVRSD